MADGPIGVIGTGYVGLTTAASFAHLDHLERYRGIPAPVVRTDPASAELGKYANNAFLAMKLSYVNMLAELCERAGRTSIRSPA